MNGVSQSAHVGWYTNSSKWIFHRGPFIVTLAQGLKKMSNKFQQLKRSEIKSKIKTLSRYPEVSRGL